MRIKHLLSIIFMCICSISYSQNDIAEWKLINIELQNDILTFDIQADINDQWYIYALDNHLGGPLSLSLNALDESLEPLTIKLSEKTYPKKYHDKIFDMEVKIYAQEILINCQVNISTELKKIILIIDGQACNSIDGACKLVSERIEIKTN